MAKKYNCKSCGAELFFDPKTGKLHCDYCGSDFDPSEYAFNPEEESDDQTIPQFTDENGAPSAETTEKATDDSVSTDDLVVYKCPNCGAEVITSKKTVATTCVYCNRAITLTGNVSGDWKPDYVLPFKKERKEVEAAYKSLCKQSILTPRYFTRDSTIERIKGMSVPYLLYSFNADASMSVRAQNVRVYMSGQDEITETSSYHIVEEGAGSFDRIPADAMKEMDNIMMDSIEPFDFSALEKFNPAYLTGFYTQRWDDSSADNEPRAKDRAKSALTREVLDHVGTYTSRTVESEQYHWSDQKVEQAMLPVWMMYTEYKGKKYVFGMNGQTGKMMGGVPRDPMRLVEIGAAVFIVSQIIMMIIRILGVL